MTAKSSRAWLALPAVLAIAGCARVLGGQFQLDDFVAIEQNPSPHDRVRA